MDLSYCKIFNCSRQKRFKVETGVKDDSVSPAWVYSPRVHLFRGEPQKYKYRFIKKKSRVQFSYLKSELSVSHPGMGCRELAVLDLPGAF